MVYSSNDDLWWIAADGSGRPESLLVSVGSHFAGSITPDGRTVVFQETGSGTSGIRTLAFDSAPAARTIIPAAFGESAPVRLSRRTLAGVPIRPDGTDGGVRRSPIRCPAPASRSRCRAAREPVWAHNGRELFYRSGDSLMVASVTLSPTFAVAGRRRLFTGSFLSGGTFREYDVAPDDQHFVMITGGAAQSVLYRGAERVSAAGVGAGAAEMRV